MALKLLTLLLGLSMLTGCGRPEFNAGETCALNSDCASPLICQLERCRRQCIDSRDCGAGLLCLRIGATGGACQLPEEANCTLTSDCRPDDGPEGLVCRFGTCTTECREDRDCASGALCEADEMGGSACVEPIRDVCIWNSDCPEPFVCGPDQQCQLECIEDRDCPSRRFCNLATNLCEIGDGGP